MQEFNLKTCVKHYHLEEVTQLIALSQMITKHEKIFISRNDLSIKFIGFKSINDFSRCYFLCSGHLIPRWRTILKNLGYISSETFET